MQITIKYKGKSWLISGDAINVDTNARVVTFDTPPDPELEAILVHKVEPYYGDAPDVKPMSEEDTQ